MLHIKSAKYVSGMTLWVAFDNGESAEIDLSDALEGPIFAPLKDPLYFSKLSVDPELETVVWPNGADLAPEFLRDLYSKQSQTKAENKTD